MNAKKFEKFLQGTFKLGPMMLKFYLLSNSIILKAFAYEIIKSNNYNYLIVLNC